jgi:hypothetical protein
MSRFISGLRCLLSVPQRMTSDQAVAEARRNVGTFAINSIPSLGCGFTTQSATLPAISFLWLRRSKWRHADPDIF